MDRAEALVWALRGYSKNQQRPFTGAGGPLQWVGNGSDSYDAPNGATTPADIATARRTSSNFQINIESPNSFFDFKIDRLSFSAIDDSTAISSANRYLSTDDSDLFLTYAAREGGAPFVYFDSRTYGLHDATLGFNGYANSTFGSIRAYMSTKSKANPSGAYANLAQAADAWQFMNADKFQIISAGLDNHFGSAFATNQIFYQYPTGQAILPSTSASVSGDMVVSGVRAYLEATYGATEEHQQDNLTNFSSGPLVDDVP